MKVTTSKKMPKKAKKASKRKAKLTPEQKIERATKRAQEKEIRLIFKNLGFQRINNIDGKEFFYEGRTSEMDDIFVCENVILIVEYTISKNPGDHIKNKTIFYNKVLENRRKFIEFITTEPKLVTFFNFYESNIKDKYTLNQLKLEILYCSISSVALEHKNNAKDVIFFDYNLVQYFKSLSKVIKRTGKYEFLDFIGIPYEQFGNNILTSDSGKNNTYLGHILPEEKSSFKLGYKVVSFYIDANSLMRRAFVLRQEGWREKDNIGHYQRMFEAKKISSMRKYLTEKGRVFINNIITTISESKIKLYGENDIILKINKDGQFTNLETDTKVTPTRIEITDECNIIGIIDGQHRTFAYHEGDDLLESKIKKLRHIQNLLVTGIIFPSTEEKEKRLKFEANLFLEINSTQSSVKSKLKQEIELMISPFSLIAICKRILKKLNESGPFHDLIEEYSFEKGKLKTASIVSFGLKPLIKMDEKSDDTLFSIWSNNNKLYLKDKESEEFKLLDEYVLFASDQIRNLFIAVKKGLNQDQWNFSNSRTPNGVLNVTFFNGVLNVLRFIIENNQLKDAEGYLNMIKNKNFDKFPFKNYKSSQYRKMGEDLYNTFFKVI